MNNQNLSPSDKDWILKRTDTGEELHLFRQFIWIDEYDWTQLAQSDPVRTLSGGMVIQQGTKKSGRPISLNGDKARITRKDLKTLQEWMAVPKLTMTLTHPQGANYTVIFNRPAISTPEPRRPSRPADNSDDDLFVVNVYLMTV